MASSSVSETDRRLLARVHAGVASADEMFARGAEHYFGVGLSAIHCIDTVLQQTSPAEIKSVLDMPSGYGRVLRFLMPRFPQASVTACELMDDAVRFCAATFGAVPAHSNEELNALDLHTRFDLIWCGSLATHLDADNTRALLHFFARHLTRDGVLVMSTHGELVARRLASGVSYGLSNSDRAHVVSTYEQTGYGYADYPYANFADKYGISLCSPEWMRREARAAGLREVSFQPQGWFDHQDVYGFVLDPPKPLTP